MTTATYVAIVSAEHRDELRDMLLTEHTWPLSWREDRRRGFSEFYFSGPPALARRAHTYVADWVIGHEPSVRCRGRRGEPGRRPATTAKSGCGAGERMAGSDELETSCQPR